MASVGNVDVNVAAKNMFVTVKITGVKQFRFRLWLTTKILRIARFVCPVSLFIEIEGPGCE